MTNVTERPFQIWTHRCLLLAVAGGIVCLVVAWQQIELFWHAYLYAFLVCWLVIMGATGLFALSNLTGGKWAVAGRPFYVAAMKTMPVAAILFIPIGLELAHIYPWARASAAAEFHFSAAKEAYFSPTFFLGRAVGYFLVWLFVAWLLGRILRWDLAPGDTSGMRRAGALSLVLLVPTTTFAAFDWSMSLEPKWYSSIYGAICTASGVLAAQALAVLGLGILSKSSPADLRLVTRTTSTSKEESEKNSELAEVSNDMGNLLLAFVMVWTYFSFSQFLIIWSGNLPSEIPWYLVRMQNGWQFVALLIVLLNFVIPFLLLLSRDLKRNPWQLAGVALLIFAIYDVQIYWTVVPAFGSIGLWGHVANFAALLAVGGLWLALVCWQAERSIQLCRSTD